MHWSCCVPLCMIRGEVDSVYYYVILSHPAGMVLSGRCYSEQSVFTCAFKRFYWLFNILSRRQPIVLSVVSFLRIYCWNIVSINDPSFQ